MNWLQRTSGSKERVQRMRLLKVIPLHSIALRLEMGKLRKHDDLSSASTGWPPECGARKRSVVSCLLLGCGYECRSKLSAGDFLRVKIMA